MGEESLRETKPELDEETGHGAVDKIPPPTENFWDKLGDLVMWIIKLIYRYTYSPYLHRV